MYKAFTHDKINKITFVKVKILFFIHHIITNLNSVGNDFTKKWIENASIIFSSRTKCERHLNPDEYWTPADGSKWADTKKSDTNIVGYQKVGLGLVRIV